ncbi:MAG: hypothetical protein NZM07_00295 [Elioraea sp.]|nr:hypothetical protein [Elioraea sp.]
MSVDGKAPWASTNPGWRADGGAARLCGLDAGLFWRSVPDPPHVQTRKASSPLAAGMTLRDIDAAMRERRVG